MRKLFLPLLIMLSGCASLPLIESQDLSDPESRSKYMYDIDNSIAYKIQHDANFVYLEFTTDDEITIQKITRNGLFIYMDPKGGKSKDIYFNYPLQRKPGRGEMKKLMQKMKQSSQERNFDVVQLLDNLNVEAIYSKDDMAEMIPVYAKSDEFKVELSAASSTEFVYKLRIPINEIIENKNDEQELAIGIMTGEFELPNRQDGGQQGGGQGDGMSGGRPGGGMQGNSGGGMQTSDEMTKMQEQISIWFKIVL